MRNRAAVRVVGPLNWIGVPTLVCIALSIALTTPVQVLGFKLPEIIFPMALAFAWPLIRPSVLGPVVLFFLGLFEDLLYHLPLGAWALGLLGVYGLITATRHLIVGQDGPVLLGWWLGAICGAFTLVYLIIWTADGMAPTLIGTFLQLLVTLCLFPFANSLVQRFDDGDVRFR